MGSVAMACLVERANIHFNLHEDEATKEAGEHAANAWGTDRSQSAAPRGRLLTSTPIDCSKWDTLTVTSSSIAEGEDIEEEGKMKNQLAMKTMRKLTQEQKNTKRRHGMAMKWRMRFVMKMFAEKAQKRRPSNRRGMKEKTAMKSERKATRRKKGRTKTPRLRKEKMSKKREQTAEANERGESDYKERLLRHLQEAARKVKACFLRTAPLLVEAGLPNAAGEELLERLQSQRNLFESPSEAGGGPSVYQGEN